MKSLLFNEAVNLEGAVVLKSLHKKELTSGQVGECFPSWDALSLSLLEIKGTKKMERQKNAYIFLSSSTVTSINSWKAKSSLSSVVSYGSLSTHFVQDPTDLFTIVELNNSSQDHSE